MTLKHLHSAWHRADTPRISNITHYYYFRHCCCPLLPVSRPRSPEDGDPSVVAADHRVHGCGSLSGPG